MKVIKKINNNVAICVDNNNHELIAFGKGIGFPQMPYELTDLNKIDRTYYGVNQNYLGLLDEIPEDIFEISAKIVDYAKGKIMNEVNSNITFTLADHINFAIQRYKKNMVIKMPFSYDMQHLYETEMRIGEVAVKFINKVLAIHLSKDEAVGIALHFINSENMKTVKNGEINENQVISDITSIIEKEFHIEISKKGFNYSRFVSHMQYLLKRKEKDISIISENEKMFEMMKTEYQETYDCVLEIKRYIEEKLGWNPSNEELLYLMLHVNRLCSREDCNR